jgi:hypothetical protein
MSLALKVEIDWAARNIKELIAGRGFMWFIISIMNFCVTTFAAGCFTEYRKDSSPWQTRVLKREGIWG